MRRLLLALLLLPGLALAQADPGIPQWDMREICEYRNRLTSSESPYMLRACIASEEDAARFVNRDWAATPAAIRRTCAQRVHVSGFTSYYMLNACMQVEMRAAKELERR